MSSELHEVDQPFVRMMIGTVANAVDLNVMPNHLISFTYEDNISYADVVEVHLFDETFGELENLILGAGLLENTDPRRGDPSSYPAFRFQYGWARGPRSPVLQASVVEYVPTFDIGRGTEIMIRAVLVPQQMMLTQRDQVWAEGKTLRDVAGFYAGLNKLKLEVEASKPLTRRIHQRGMTDWAFISKEVVNAFVPASGKGSYVATVMRGDTLRISTQNNATTGAKKTEYRYRFGHGNTGVIESYSPKFEPTALLALGAGGVRIEAFDPRTKKPISKVVTDSSMPGRVNWTKDTVPSLETPSVVRAAFHDEESAKRFAERKFQLMNTVTAEADAVIHGNPEIQVHDIVNIDVLQGAEAKTLHWSSGRWTVRKAVHRISADGDYKTELSLIRAGVPKGAPKETTSGKQTTANDTKEPTTIGISGAAANNGQTTTRSKTSRTN